MRTIRQVEVIRIAAPEWETPAWWGTSPMDALMDEGGDSRARPMAVFNSVPERRRDDVLYLLIRVELNDGTYGIGAIGLGSEGLAKFIEGVLAPLVEGESPFDTERLWTRMFRATINVGRRGAVLIGISGIDIALWDILGKLTGQPVYNLLGGMTRPKIRAYCSAGYPMDDLGEMAELARKQLSNGGYTAFKMRFGYGPRHGRKGMRKNIDLVRTIREALGDEIDLMADAYMGWDARYAIDMILRLDEFELKWVEEPTLPDDMKGYAQIRRSVRTPISGGEHESTRWGFRDLIVADAVDYLQPDVNRVGGVTEARKIWALAQAYDLPVVPHSHNFHNQHLIISHMNSPLSEHFPTGFRDADTFLSEFITGEAELADGWLTLSDRPGFGVDLNEAMVEQFRIAS